MNLANIYIYIYNVFFGIVLQRALEAFIIILAATELLYLLSLHAGILHASYGPTYRNNNVAGNTGVTGTKAANYGTPAASAV